MKYIDTNKDERIPQNEAYTQRIGNALLIFKSEDEQSSFNQMLTDKVTKLVNEAVNNEAKPYTFRPTMAEYGYQQPSEYEDGGWPDEESKTAYQKATEQWLADLA